MKPDVTIALPVYNGASTLRAAVCSILEQSFTDWELIILDDASTDNSLEVLRSFDDPRICLVEGKKNMGLSARLNMAVDMARGRYFVRMDQDDISYFERLEKQLEYLEAHPDVDLLATSTTVFRGVGEALGCLPVQSVHEKICAQPWNGFHMPHPTWMGRINWFRSYKYDSRADGAEDQLLLLQSYQTSRFACLNEPLLAYREGVRPLKKMMRARRIFARAYMRQFAAERRYGLAVKVAFYSLLKVAADVLNLVFGVACMRNSLRPMLAEEQSVWQMIWNRFEVGDADKIDAKERHNLSGKSVVLISTVPYFVVTQLSAQIQYFASIGMRVTIITSPGEELGKLPKSENIRVITTNISRKISVWNDFKALVRLTYLLKVGNYDILHSTTPKAGLLCAIAGIIVRIPVRLHTFTGQVWAVRSGAIRLLMRFMDRVIVKLMTHCYADSASQREFLIQEGIVHSNAISVIGQGSLGGVNLQRFSSQRWTEEKKNEIRRSLNIPEDAFVFIYVGRITKDKGVQELLEAFRRLQGGENAVHLLLVGPADDDGKSLYQEADLQVHVHCLGYQNQPERFLAISNILCLPSYREGFGTVVIEAGAMGVPCIGTEIPGLIDAVVNGETGVLVSSRDSNELYQEMLRLFNNLELIEKMGRAAKSRAEDLFDSEYVSKTMVKEYVGWLSK